MNETTKNMYNILTRLDRLEKQVRELTNKESEFKPVKSITERYRIPALPFSEQLSKFVKERRKQTGLTQVEFADKTGIAVTVIRKIEQGKTNINLQSLLQVLKMFGTTLDLKKLNPEHF